MGKPMVTLGEREIELEQRIEFTVADDFIAPPGVDEIVMAINRLPEVRDWRKKNGLLTLRFPDDWVWKQNVKGRGTYVGTLTNRVSKYVKKEVGFNLTPDTLQLIGTLAATHAVRQETFWFDITDDLDWEAGDFGDRGSCFWGSRENARSMMKRQKTLAIRFYHSLTGDGKGRAWLVNNFPNEHELTLFNGYGLVGNPTLTIARVLATYLGLAYRKVKLVNQGTDSGTLWVNSGVAYKLAKEKPKADEYLDLKWGDGRERCCHCNELVANWHIGPDGNRYCRYCYGELWVTCQGCDALISRAALVHIEADDGGNFCPACAENLFTGCDMCHERHRETALLFVNGSALSVCRTCYDRRIDRCEDCGQIFVVAHMEQPGLCWACNDHREEVYDEEIPEATFDAA